MGPARALCESSVFCMHAWGMPRPHEEGIGGWETWSSWHAHVPGPHKAGWYQLPSFCPRGSSEQVWEGLTMSNGGLPLEANPEIEDGGHVVYLRGTGYQTGSKHYREGKPAHLRCHRKPATRVRHCEFDPLMEGGDPRKWHKTHILALSQPRGQGAGISIPHTHQSNLSLQGLQCPGTFSQLWQWANWGRLAVRYRSSWWGWRRLCPPCFRPPWVSAGVALRDVKAKR